jgi:hypothetical protein
MSDGDGAVFAKQELRHRLADDVRPANHARLHIGGDVGGAAQRDALIVKD